MTHLQADAIADELLRRMYPESVAAAENEGAILMLRNAIIPLIGRPELCLEVLGRDALQKMAAALREMGKLPLAAEALEQFDRSVC